MLNIDFIDFCKNGEHLKKNSFFIKKSCTKLFITKKFLTDCKNLMYFSREFTLEATV